MRISYLDGDFYVNEAMVFLASLKLRYKSLR